MWGPLLFMHECCCNSLCWGSSSFVQQHGMHLSWYRHSLPGEYAAARQPACLQADGERLPLAVKDLGSCDLYPQSLQHNGNGRFVTVCGDGEYIIYTALAWRNKSFGSALDAVWGDDSSSYAIRRAPAAHSAQPPRWRGQRGLRLLSKAAPCTGQPAGACRLHAPQAP